MVKETPLCKLAWKYGADKCPIIGHMYTPFYYEYFKDMRESVKKVLEFGIGNYRMGMYIPGYVVGPSLRMWRDFFPNAQVYGADIAPESFFTDDRITTFKCDETDPEQVKKLIETIGGDIDIVIDDASHHYLHQSDLLRTMMPLLDKKVHYVVEDCRRTKMMRKDFPEYESFIPELLPNVDERSHDGIIVFRHK